MNQQSQDIVGQIAAPVTQKLPEKTDFLRLIKRPLAEGRGNCSRAFWAGEEWSLLRADDS
jgi:hypothetical protein